MECRTSPMDSIELARKIHASVRHRLDPTGYFSEWTRQLFTSLAEIGDSLGYERYYSGSEGFLLDFVWYEKPKHSIVLGVEIEWSSEESKYEPVSYDFEKLMQVKAPLKLMVYQNSEDTEKSKKVRDKLSNRLESFGSHVAGEEYLLLEFAKPWKRASCYRFKVLTDGKVSNPEFSPLSEIDFILDWQEKP
jgi:hypothetical protein